MSSKMIIKIILLMSVALFNANLFAAVCTSKTGPWAIDYGSIVVQRDVAIGQALTNRIDGEDKTAYECDLDNDSAYIGIKEYLSRTAISNSEGVVYKTNVPGVGVLIGGVGMSYTAYLMHSPVGIQGADWIFLNGWIGGAVHSLTLKPFIKFVKTGDITSGKPEGQIASAISAGYNTGGVLTNWAPEIPITFGAGSITVLACSISTKTLNFPLGDISASKFGGAPGVVPPGTEQTQNLGLECDAGANINVSLAGTQNPDVSENSVLALTGQSDAGVAQGVGVQLLYNGTPLELNKNIVLKKSAGGQETFPIVARYYQTKTTVMPGKADTSATLNLTYQ